jgi:hypothetical protein
LTNPIGWNFWLIIAVFNVTDTIGKWMAGTKYLGGISDTATFILTYGRLLFVLFGVMLKHQWGPDFLVNVPNDWSPIINLVLFGLTNGYCMTLLAIKTPSKAP